MDKPLIITGDCRGGSQTAPTEKLIMRTPDKTHENYETLAKLFPNAVTESIDENGVVVRAIDADVLRQEINTHVVSGKEERYQFTWPDKKKAVLLANAPIAATLRPCREESVDFDNTENLYIEGDNLDVLKLLRETYLNRVKMIYIDPPYNTGNDFIYEDDFTEDAGEFLARDSQYDEDGNRMVPNLDSNGRFHTDWLNMMYPRLRVARDLLTDDGVIFISIDDNEVENLKKICNEIYGVDNLQAIITWQRKYSVSNNYVGIATINDYILVYSKSASFLPNLLPRTEESRDRYSNPDNDPRGPWKAVDYLNQATVSQRPNLCYEIINPNNGEVIRNGPKAWKYEKTKTEALLADNRIWWGVNGNNSVPALKLFLSEVRDGMTPHNLWLYEEVGHTQEATQEVERLLGNRVFDFPKPVRLLYRATRIGTSKDSIVLDFFSGSATTAHAVMQLNAEDGGKRKFIMVQLPEVCDENSEAAKAGYKNICEIGKERIRRAGAKIVGAIRESPPGPTGGSRTAPTDTGFRVLKLASSNMKEVYYTPQDTVSAGGTFQLNLDGLIDNIKPDRSAEDLLFQVMLDLGIPLSAKIEKKTFGEQTVYMVGAVREPPLLIACFDRATDEIVTAIAKSKPYYAVFRDSSFSSDATLTNFEQIFKTYSPTTKRRVL